jgi:rod shape determining protein RodA
MNFFNLFKKYDFSFFTAMSIIFLIGLANLYSATSNSTDSAISGLYKTQLFWFGFSLVLSVSVSFIRPKNFYRFSWTLYLVNMVLLILVLVIGVKVMGAKRWIHLGFFRAQPSEFMKLAMCLILARLFSREDYIKGLNLRGLVAPAILAMVPALLIVMEPDLGTGLVLVFIFALVTFYVGLQWKIILILLAMGGLGGVGLYHFGLKDYQKKRINAFLDPELEPKGFGYNANQSKIAIGSGKIFGKGFQNSSQASLNYLPENHSDFVFSIYNEEHGLFGSIILIGLYIFMLFRFMWLASAVNNSFDSVLVVGIMSIFFCHTIVNMAMVTGLMPIVGIPLPLMSYGGSNLLILGISCGIATSISNSRTIF